jgi:hypothetical protein
MIRTVVALLLTLAFNSIAIGQSPLPPQDIPPQAATPPQAVTPPQNDPMPTTSGGVSQPTVEANTIETYNGPQKRYQG